MAELQESRPSLKNCEPSYEHDYRESRPKIDSKRVPDLYELVLRIKREPKEELLWTGVRIEAGKVDDYKEALNRILSPGQVELVPITFKNQDG